MTPLIQSFKRIWLCTLREMRPFVANRIDPYLTPHRVELLRKVFAHLDVAIDGQRHPKGGVLQATIVADFAVCKSSISRMLSKMERDGFIYRTPWREHIMYKVVHLTELGFEVMNIVRTLRFDEGAPDTQLLNAFLGNDARQVSPASPTPKAASHGETVIVEVANANDEANNATADIGVDASANASSDPTANAADHQSNASANSDARANIAGSDPGASADATTSADAIANAADHDANPSMNTDANAHPHINTNTNTNTNANARANIAGSDPGASTDATTSADAIANAADQDADPGANADTSPSSNADAAMASKADALANLTKVLPTPFAENVAPLRQTGGGTRITRREALENLYRQCNAIRIGLHDNARHLHPWRIHDVAERYSDPELGISYWRYCRLRTEDVDDRILDELPDEYVAFVGPFRADKEVGDSGPKWRRPDID